MKISLNSAKPQQRVFISEKLPANLRGEISRYKELMEIKSGLDKGQEFIFAPHYSLSGKIDCVLANYGAYTRSMALDATTEDILETIKNLGDKKPMFNVIIPNLKLI